MAMPFNEYEKRFLLAEILRTSDVPVEMLLGIIRDQQIEPKWDEVFMPPARNLIAIKAAYSDLISTAPGPAQPLASFGLPAPPPRKRRLSEPETTSVGARPLHPKPAANGAQAAPYRSPSEPGVKKRGRPTKEVLQARRAEAAAKGASYPQLKAAQRASLPGGELTFATESPTLDPARAEGSTASPLAKKARRGRGVKEEDPDVRKAMEMASAAMEVHQNPPLGDKPLEQTPTEPPVIGSLQQPPPAPTAAPAPAATETKMEGEKEVPDSMDTAPTNTLENQPSGNS